MLIFLWIVCAIFTVKAFFGILFSPYKDSTFNSVSAVLLYSLGAILGFMFLHNGTGAILGMAIGIVLGSSFGVKILKPFNPSGSRFIWIILIVIANTLIKMIVVI